MLAVAPFKQLQPPQQQQQEQNAEAAVRSAVDQDGWEQDAAVPALQQLLQQLQPLVCSSKRLSLGTTQQLVQLFFHPAMFQCR
jgi:hypothetical protein